MKPKTKYGQLPLMHIDGVEYAQSDALLRYSGGLGSGSAMPKDAMVMLKVNEALGVVGDMQGSWKPAMYFPRAAEAFGHPEGFAATDEGKAVIKKLRETWLAEKLPTHLEQLSSLIKANGGFLASDSPTIADCAAIPFLRGFTRGFMDHVPTTSLEAYPVIVEYLAKFQAIPAIKSYQDAKAAAMST